MKGKNIVIAFVFVFLCCTISIVLAIGKSFTASAKPLEFGDTWQVIESHGGKIKFKITAAPEDRNVTIIGEVKYCGPDSKEVIERFYKEINFTTGDCWANVEVRFMCSSYTPVRVFGWIGPQ